MSSTTKPRTSTALRAVAATLLAAVLVAVAVLAWPQSEADKARDDGQRTGTAALHLYNAKSADDVDEALTELGDAAAATRDHAGDAVAEQVDDQRDALERAADGFVGAHTAEDSWDADLYQAELDTAVDDLTAQASDFRNTGSDVQQAYWDGFYEGFAGD